LRAGQEWSSIRPLFQGPDRDPLPSAFPGHRAATRADRPYSLAGEAGERWPVVDGIAYLRTGREALVGEVLGLLDRNRRDEALMLLLADRADPAPRPADSGPLRGLVAERASLTLREAIARLGLGPAGDYFLQRWSDPSYVASLALLEAHWNRPRCVFDLGCGIGPHLRELLSRGFKVAGGDLVFAHLWLARHWVAGEAAQLFCLDGRDGWPIEGAPVDLVMCHDALPLMEPAAEVLNCLRQTAGDDGWLVATHLPTREERSADAPVPAVSAETLDELFPDGLVYDEAELRAALTEARAPAPLAAAGLGKAAFVSAVFGPGMRPAPRAIADGLALPPQGASLRRNPLYRRAGNGAYAIAWPSDAYRAACEGCATYPARSHAPRHALASPDTAPMARRRELVDLPERW
jgi:SAM-dependent methyltransferase